MARLSAGVLAVEDGSVDIDNIEEEKDNILKNSNYIKQEKIELDKKIK